jgi:hypothetical protein
LVESSYNALNSQTRFALDQIRFSGIPFELAAGGEAASGASPTAKGLLNEVCSADNIGGAHRSGLSTNLNSLLPQRLVAQQWSKQK